MVNPFIWLRRRWLEAELRTIEHNSLALRAEMMAAPKLLNDYQAQMLRIQATLARIGGGRA